jgi:hypothetical protein
MPELLAMLSSCVDLFRDIKFRDNRVPMTANLRMKYVSLFTPQTVDRDYSGASLAGLGDSRQQPFQRILR